MDYKLYTNKYEYYRKFKNYIKFIMKNFHTQREIERKTETGSRL